MISIYGLKDPEDGIIKYVGASSNPADRKWTHLYDKGNKDKFLWVVDLKKRGLRPELIIFETCIKSIAPRRENFYIKKYGLGNLLNVKKKSNIAKLLKNRIVINLTDDIVKKLNKKIQKSGHRSPSSYVRGLVYKDVL